MRGIKVSSKIGLGYLCLVIISAALVSFLIVLLVSVKQSSVFLADDAMPLMRQTGALERSIAGLNLNMRGFYYSQDEAFFKTAQDILPETDRLLRETQNNLAKFNSQGRGELTDIVNQLHREVGEIKKQMEANGQTMTKLKDARDNFRDLHDEAFERISKLYDQVREIMAQANENGAQADAERMDRFVLWCDGLWDNYEAAKVFFWQGQALRSSKEMNQADESMRDVSKALKGLADEPDLDEVLKPFVSDLELSIPASIEAMNEFYRNWGEGEGRNQTLSNMLKKASETINSLYHKTESLALAGANDTRSKVAEALIAAAVGLTLMLVVGLIGAFLTIRSITGSINRAIGQLTDSAVQVDQNAGQFATVAHELANGAQENSASLNEVSSALEELSSMTRQNSENSELGNSIMSETHNAMDAARASMNQLTKAMDEISSSGSEIGKIIKTIDEIAFQTNLLALNAAVEAARNTAELIASTINNINAGTSLTRSTDEHFGTMAQGLVKVGQVMGEVASASQEQFSSLTHIDHAMKQMEIVTRKNATEADHSASASQALTNQSTELMETVTDLRRLF